VRRVCLMAATAVVLLAASASTASATTWSGNCTWKQRTTLLAPSYLVPSQHGYQIRGTGSCDGLLDGRAYKGPTTVFIDGRMNRPMSCETGISQDIPGSITFTRAAAPAKAKKAATSDKKKGKKKKHRKPRKPPPPPPPPRLDITVQEAHLLMALRLQVAGVYGGLGFMSGTYQSDFETLRTCAGKGVSQLDGDLNMSTVRELYG
jgi:hypothetical protein